VKIRCRLKRRCCVIATFLVVALGLWPAPVSAADQKRVLVVYSTRRDTQMAIVGDRNLPRLLETGLGTKPDIYSEYIDIARFPDEQYRTAFDDYLRIKYAGQHFDLLIAANQLAVDFLAGCRDSLFPRVPIVYFTENPATPRPPNSTGMVASNDYAGTVAFARQLQPDLKSIFVVVGSSQRDAATEAIARAQFEAFEPQITFAYSSGLTTQTIERRVSTLPAHWAVYYVLMYQDAAGVNVNPLEYLNRIASAANRPVYSWVNSSIGHGVIGGKLMRLESRFASIAIPALRVLRGERADTIPLAAGNMAVPEVDWREIRRWGIDPARIPEGTTVSFREPTVFSRYRAYILGAVSVVIAQFMLIGGLLVQGRRLRRAEKIAREHEAELRASYERIRDLGGRLLVAQDAERSRIARELHDDIGQQLTLLTLDLDRLRRTPPTRLRPNDVSVTIDRLQAVVGSVHDISHRLHPQKVRLLGLVSALGSINRDLPSSSAVYTFTHEGVPDRLPDDLTLCLYRVAQEAIQNALKHSGASEIRVRLVGSPQALTLTVVDNGVGFDIASVQDEGLGLMSMRERLEPYGGTLTIESEVGHGTEVTAVAPFDAFEAMSARPEGPGEVFLIT
jgi:signal transduction histidine kinase